MNIARISGRLEGIEGQFDAQDNRFLTATLRFQGGAIRIAAVGENIHWLERFHNGDVVKLEGRLASGNGSLALLVDSCEEFTIAKPRRAESAQERRDLCDVRHSEATRRKKASFR